MLSLLNNIDSSIKTFLNQLFESLGVVGFLCIILGIEVLFIVLFSIKTVFSYEARLKRTLDKLNKWLFVNKKIDESNITEFNALIKKGPKRLTYYWQQYILYREGTPADYLTEENVIEKPLKTSSWSSNITTLTILSCVWAVVSLIFGFASQPTQTFTAQIIAYALTYPFLVLTLAAIAILFIKGKRVINLDDIYHLHHIFSRFLTNACAELTPYLDFDLLFTPEEIENGNAQLREYYEARARKAKQEFEDAKQKAVKDSDFDFEKVGVDGSLLLNRAMKESETYINKKTTALAQIAQVEAQKEALRRNYENVQMDLQRKIQASKENIQKLIEQQAATTSRIEVGLLKQQQDKEVSKQASLQRDYDQEESRYKSSKEELDKEIDKLNVVLKECLDEATSGMMSEYKSFFEKVMRSAYKVAERKVIDEKNELIKQRDKNETELINVQTQIKRLMDENVTLRSRLDEVNSKLQEFSQTKESEQPEGNYDENGNFVYADGSYHDVNGLFHDVNGKVYDLNGAIVSQEENPEEAKNREEKQIEQESINQFGDYITEEELKKDIVEEQDNVIKDELKPEYVEKKDDDISLEKLIENAISQDEQSTTQSNKKDNTSKESKKPAKKKATTEEPEKKKTTRKKKEKTVVEDGKKDEKLTKQKSSPTKKRSRAKKDVTENSSIDEINKLINEEEEKINSIKDSINSKIDEALKNNDLDKERDDLTKSIESLQEQAEKAKANGESEEVLADINKKLEELIKKLGELNNK